MLLGLVPGEQVVPLLYVGQIKTIVNIHFFTPGTLLYLPMSQIIWLVIWLQSSLKQCPVNSSKVERVQMKVKKVRITARQVREKAWSRALLRKKNPFNGTGFQNLSPDSGRNG